ncbi:MAG: EpsG family protein, partial [Pedobacter sp.]
MIYLLIIFFLSLFSFLELFGIQPIEKLFVIFITFLLLFFFSALRYETGPDYGSYKIYFEELDISFLGFLEPIYIVLLVFYRDYLSASYQFFLATIAFISISLKFNFFYKTSKLIFLTLILYFCSTFINHDFGQVRQGIATSFILLAFYYQLKGEKWLYFLLVAIAVGFHYSAIVALLSLVIIRPNISLKAMVLVMIATLFIGLLMQPQFVAPIFNLILPSAISQKVMDYFTNEFGERLGLSFGRILRLIPVIIGHRYLLNTQRNKKIWQPILNLYFSGVVMFFILSFNSVFAARISSYFISLDMIIVPSAIY